MGEVDEDDSVAARLWEDSTGLKNQPAVPESIVKIYKNSRHTAGCFLG